MNSERHILSILLENTSGALAHVAGLFAARGYNIESISAAPTENPTVTRITIGSRGDAPTVEQIMKHLNRLIEVIKVLDLTENEYVERASWTSRKKPSRSKSPERRIKTPPS